MDIVVRRQSEQLNRRHFSESMDDDDNNDKSKNKESREIYDYRRWEWGNLRVIYITLTIIYILFQHFTFNIKLLCVIP